MERIEFHSRLPRKWIAINVSPHPAVWKVGAYDQPFIRDVCKEHPYLESSLLLVSLCSFFLCLPDRGQLTTLSERHRNQLCCNASSVLTWIAGKEVQLKHLLATIWINVLGFFLMGQSIWMWHVCKYGTLISLFISQLKGYNLFHAPWTPTLNWLK